VQGLASSGHRILSCRITEMTLTGILNSSGALEAAAPCEISGAARLNASQQ